MHHATPSGRETFVVAAVILLALAPAPLANAAEPPLLTDKEGDVTITTGPGGAPAPIPANAQTASADLRSLELVEGDIDFAFTLRLAGLAQPGGSLNAYVMTFVWMDANFEVGLFRSHVDPTSAPLSRAALSLCQEACVRVTDLEHTLDEAGGSYSFLVPKRYITSLEGHAPVFGSDLTGVTVKSLVTIDGFPGTPTTGARAEDVMPDSGSGVITLSKGGSANGHIVLEAPDPVRVSNGGATTFVFNAHVQNELDVEDSVTFALEGVPAAWSATTPGAQKVPPKSEKPVFILATIPFGHEHGGFTAFNLTATSVKDPAVKASLRFGVLHTPVPMPAGHHSDIYLHAAPGDSGLFQTAFPRTDVTMSTQEDHANDLTEALPNEQGVIGWRIPLAPQLAIGVDMDLNRTGKLVASVNGRMDGQATMTGELWLTKGDTDVALLGTLSTAKLALSQNSASQIQVTFTSDPASDYAPYAAGHNLELRLTLTPDDAALPPNPNSPPSLNVQDFKLSLPLNEYADAPTFEEGEGSNIQIEAVDALEKTSRPGQTVTYAFRVTSLAASATEYALDIAGTHAKNAQIAPSGAIRLEPNQPQTVTLAVRVPNDAQNDERLESILVIRSQADPSDLTLARTSTLVSRTSDAQDEQAKFDAAKNGDNKTPAVGAWAIAAIAIAAIAMGRKERAT